MRSRKIIKKLIQITAILLLLLFAIPATAFFMLQSNRLQTSLVTRIMAVVSADLKTKFTLSKIEIAFFYRVRLHDVYLEDLAGDTLVNVENLTIGIRYINPFKKEISIGSINADNATVGFAIDSAHNLNVQYFIQKLKGNGKGNGGWTVRFNNIRLRDSRFTLKNYNSEPVKSGVNYSDMRLSALNADVKHFKPSRDSLSFYIKLLHFNEICGFKLEKLSGNFSLGKTFLSFRNVKINTPYSSVEGDDISLNFKKWGEFKADSFVRFVKLRVNLKHSFINFTDIGYFAPVFYNTNQTVSLSGQVKGPVSNLKGKDLNISFGNGSVLKGELNLEGLPDFHSTFIYADIIEMSTTAGDLESFSLPGNRNIKVPGQFTKLGKISYQGKFTGFIDDFVAFGKFNTGLGTINTDLLFRPDTSNYVDFEGRLNATDFKLGTLLNDTANIGKISLSVSVNGSSAAGKSIDASLKGIIQHFEFRKYSYSNINLSGNLKNKTFNGSVEVNDPNIELEFLGQVNLSDSIPAFDFTANVTDANFYALNIEKSDPDFTTSFYLIAKAQGNSINSLNGEIKLLNSLFTKKDKQLQIYDFSIVSGNSNNGYFLRLRSDFVDADLSGDYELTGAKESFLQFIYTYMPALNDSMKILPVSFDNSFNLTATIKNAKPLFDFFLPDYFLADKSSLQCSYQSDNKELNAVFTAPKLAMKGITWNGLMATFTANESKLDFELGVMNLKLGNNVRFENFTVIAGASDDTSGIQVRWNNWQDLRYKGDLKAVARVSRTQGHLHPHISVDLYPATVIANDSVWTINPTSIMFDSTSIRFGNLLISHGNDFFNLEGTLSENPDDRINLLFNHFNLGNLNGLTQASGFKLGGILNGKASVSNIYSNTLFTSLLNIDSLLINNEILGNAEINSSWDDIRKAVSMEAHAMRDNLKTIDINGTYIPAGTGKLDFRLELDKLRLNIFNPYLKGIFSDLRGIASGKATLTGTRSKPILNGELNMQKSAFTINYLKTRYNFTEKIKIENNNVYFNNVRIYDPKGNSAYLTGAIRNRYLKDFQLDLTIRSQDFMCMNTTMVDNRMLYGTAFATGLIKIGGPLKNLTMDISATTSKNTSISIPLSSGGELNEYNFITIFNEGETEKTKIKEPDYQVDLSGMQINFDLTVTPDAEVQIIFDPKLGDIIKGRGNGNLDMKISTTGNFVIFGEYTIEKGDYLFTLQNFINRKVTIEPGGKIRWNGDPFDATIDIVANYRTKASMGDLYPGTDDRKIEVYDRLTMTGMLMNPDVQYDIYLPNSDEDTRMKLKSAISSADDLNKQFISILIQNRFVPNTAIGQSSASASPYSNAVGVNASEFLSNQLSHWLSQISNDVDVGINYRSNREMKNNEVQKSDEVQVALSTQLFNDRLTINGSVDVATNAAVSASDNIVGEFDIDYKITKNGKFRVKTYNHINNEMLTQNSAYTQGFGVFYKEEFNTIGELWRRYWKSISGKKEEKADPVVVEP